ncbi:MAG: dTDP-glucose 4,6-dehydratase [Gammaproteobacteria bacterium]|nr:dTDP-glucose 4,6-dehydratase [Gammaproteobacteria bacterium]
MKKLLITGGAGFIGSNFIHYWQKQHPTDLIVNLDALTYAGNLSNLEHLPHPDQHLFIKGDIQDQALVEQLLQTHQIDTLVHFAAESHVDRSIQDPDIFVKTNILGTQALLEAARKIGHCHFHHISTDEVYGSLNMTDPAFTETTPYQPNSPYSASKAASDHLVRAYHHTFGLPVTTSNCSNNFGPRQHSEKLIPTLIRSCMEWQPIPIYGNGSNIRDWLYVEDHCSAIDLILQKGQIGEVYNIGGHNEWNNLDIARLICQIFDQLKPHSQPYESLIRFVKDRPGHDQRYAINPHKMISELGWRHTPNFENHLKALIISKCP